jgi:metal-responsive CopG/Arc/MetJ family transcriptional regulator
MSVDQYIKRNNKSSNNAHSFAVLFMIHDNNKKKVDDNIDNHKTIIFYRKNKIIRSKRIYTAEQQQYKTYGGCRFERKE